MGHNNIRGRTYIAKACLVGQSLGLQASNACQYGHSVHGKRKGGGGERERKETCLVNLSNAIVAKALIFKNMMCLQK